MMFLYTRSKIENKKMKAEGKEERSYFIRDQTKKGRLKEHVSYA